MQPGDKIATYDPFAPQGSHLQPYWLRPWEDALATRHNALWRTAYDLQLRSDLILKGIEPVRIDTALSQGICDEPK